jgi:conserved oligomeric Golgi complex subunit 3
MAASRSNTPALNIRTQHSKSTLTIEEWEAKAPLGEAETKSVAAIKAVVEQKPALPLSSARVSPFHVPYSSLQIISTS